MSVKTGLIIGLSIAGGFLAAWLIAMLTTLDAPVNDQLCQDWSALVTDNCIDDGIKLDSYYRVVSIYEMATSSSHIKTMVFYDKVESAKREAFWHLASFTRQGYMIAHADTLRDNIGVVKFTYVLYKPSGNVTDIYGEKFSATKVGTEAIESMEWQPYLCGTNGLDRHVYCYKPIVRHAEPHSQ